MPEIWDLYDRHLTPLGKTHIRGEKLNEGEFHIVVQILAMNKEGKVLITKRHPDKPFGDKWEISGGSAVSGETHEVAAKRELFEETGLVADELSFLGTIVRNPTGCIYMFYLYQDDFSEKDIVLQEKETVDFKLVFPCEIKEMTIKGEFLDFLYHRIKAVYSDIFGEQI